MVETNIPVNSLKTILKSDGQKYSVRANRKRFFYPIEWQKFFDNLESNAQRRTFHILINTGARINEAFNLKVGDVDFSNNRLVLRVTKVRSKQGQKNPEPRTIPISKEFSRYLRTLKDELNLSNEDTFKLLTNSAANLAMKKILKRCGIADYFMFSIHNIRKTFEVWMIALGVDTLPLVAHMGHDVKTASTNYVSPDVFTYKERDEMRKVVGDIYTKR